MPLTLLLQTPLTAALANALFTSLWQGTLLILVVALVLRLLPGLTSAARAAVWAAVLATVALHPLLAFAGHSSAPTGGNAVHVAFSFSVYLVMLWAAASLFRLSQLAIGAVQLWAILRTAQPLATTPAIDALLCRAPRGRGCVSPHGCTAPAWPASFVRGFCCQPTFSPTLTKPNSLRLFSTNSPTCDAG